MAEGYALLSRKITRSSLWVNHDHVVRSIWTSLLSLADMDGVVWGSDAMIAVDCIASREEFDRCLEVLLAPDPESASPVEEGRRLVRVTAPRRGLRIVTWDEYQDRWSFEARRDAAAERKRRQRSGTRNQQLIEQMSHGERDKSRHVPFHSPPTLPDPTQPNPTIPPKPPKGGASKEAQTRMTSDWVPSDACYERIARGSKSVKDCPREFADECLPRFVDYYTTKGKGGHEQRDEAGWDNRFTLWVWDNWKGRDGDDYRRANGIELKAPPIKMNM